MRLLWVRLSSLGDVVHNLPAISYLSEQGIQVDVLTENSFVEILRHHRGVEKIIPVNLRALKKSPFQLIKHFFSLRKLIKSEKYDAVIDGHGLLKSALLACNTAKWVIGGNRFSVHEYGVNFFYKQKVSIDLNVNVLKGYRQLAINAVRILPINNKILLENLKNQSPDFGLTIKYEAEKKDKIKRIFFLHGISKFPMHRQWEISSWLTLAQKLIADGMQVFTIYQSDYEKTTAEKMQSIGVQVLPKQTLSQLINIFSDGKKIDAIICFDSGLGHLANAIGVPTIMMFGPTSAQRVNTAHLPKQKYLSVDYHCAPCNLRSCKELEGDNKNPPCWQSVSVEKVYQELLTIL